MYGSGYYSSWIVYVLPAVLLGLFAQSLIMIRYNKYLRVSSGTNLTGADIARIILDRNGLRDVEIRMTRGTLTDHYDPRNKTVNLSDNVFRGTSVSSMAIAAHEVGHAIQDGEDYALLKFRTGLAPIASIGSQFVWALVFLGFIVTPFFIELGIALFIGVVLFQVITLPVEINASRRALMELENGILTYEKVDGTKKVLQAAALTYVAATLASIGELMRILSYTSDRRE